jgi:hypothetical protein
MTEELFITGTLSTQAFAELVQAYAAPELAFVMLEELPQRQVKPKDRLRLLRFELFQPGQAFPLTTTGRIFHEHGEIRWLSTSSKIQIVYTGDAAYGITLPQSRQEAFSEDRYEKIDRQYFLFGKQLDETQLQHIGPPAEPGDFAEVRIPRLLRYPRLNWSAGTERLQLTVYEYIDRATGANVAYRFHGLLPFARTEEKTPA